MPDILNVLIVDDHPLFRKGLIAALNEYNDVQITGEAGSSEEALGLIYSKRPDIIILDVNLPGKSGVEFSKEIRSLFTDIKIILLTMHKDEEIFNKTIEYGINGYLLKESAVDELIKAIHAVSCGNYYLSPSISDYVVYKKNKDDKLIRENPGMNNLTDKERDILKLIAHNKSTKEIASELLVSFKTIENHRANICRKLGISGSNALLKFVIENKDNL